MQSGDASPGQAGNGNRSTIALKNKKPYIRPKAAIVTPDQAEAQVNAKALRGSPDYNDCLKLITEARRRH